MSLSLYDINNAPSEAIADELRNSEKAFGFVPNLHKAMAASYETLTAYKVLHTSFQNTSFDPTELTVVWQTINNFHECHYCVPAHTAIGHMLKVDETIINALHNGETVQDPKLAALQATALEITESRGHLSDATKQAFFDAGYGEKQLVEIVLGVSQKVLSNYINHLAETPLDEQFSQFAK
jgi:alkylhydroperoxidase family enzyme